MEKLDYNKLRATNIREILIKEYGMDENDVEKIKGKRELVNALKVQRNEVDPEMTDEEWHSYVMGHFLPDELQDGNPTTDGLRRVAELLLGNIVSIITDVVDSSAERAVIRASVSFDRNGDFRRVDGIAEANGNNTPEPFNKFLVATAETRAEGRVYRKALRLRKVLAAEEVGGEDIPTSIDSESITQQQIAFMNALAHTDRLNINLAKLIKNKHSNISGILDIKQSEAKALVKELQKYQQAPESVPNELLGYSQSWENEL